jgi:hypothetical protein
MLTRPVFPVNLVDSKETCGHPQAHPANSSASWQQGVLSNQEKIIFKRYRNIDPNWGATP